LLWPPVAQRVELGVERRRNSLVWDFWLGAGLLPVLLLSSAGSVVCAGEHRGEE
jgi:hypothetical protein